MSLNELAERVEKLEGPDNNIDVQVEVAMFRPDDGYIAARPNAAGTKVIYTTVDGRDETFRAQDWTMGCTRVSTAATLRALSALGQSRSSMGGEG